MSGIDPITGLPEEIGSFEELAKETQDVLLSTQKRRFGKVHTVIEGLDDKEINMKDLTKQLKSKFATGGTIKDGIIDLHGDQMRGVKDVLIELGFPPDSIKMK
jgi:translation initiation factor 1